MQWAVLNYLISFDHVTEVVLEAENGIGQFFRFTLKAMYGISKNTSKITQLNFIREITITLITVSLIPRPRGGVPRRLGNSKKIFALSELAYQESYTKKMC